MESSLSENIDLEDDDFDLEDDLEDFEDEYIDSEEEPEDLDKWIAEAKKYSNVTIQKKYPPVPFEDEFKVYLINSYFPNKTRYKMLTNLRKLNSLIINNGRGDSDWLQKLADRASNGLNIRYSRLIADKMIHSAMENIDNTDEISISDLRGGLTAIGKYIDFLILKSKI